MTNLVAQVLLKADGSGVVGQARESRAAVAELKKEIGATATAAAGLDKVTGSAVQKVKGLGAGAREAAKEEAQLEKALRGVLGAIDPNVAAQERLNRQLGDAKRLLDAGKISSQQYAQVQEQVGRQLKSGTVSVGQQRAAYTNLGRQFQDITMTLGMGINPLVVLAQQGGQTADAMTGLGGKAGAVGRFFAGGWGSLIFAGGLVLQPFIEKLLETSSALDENAEKAEKAAQGADSYGRAQSLVGRYIDLTTGKIKTQNLVYLEHLRVLAQVEIATAKDNQRKANKTLDDIAEPTVGQDASAIAQDVLASFTSNFRSTGTAANQKALQAELAPLKTIITDFQAVMNDPKATKSAVGEQLQKTNAQIAALGATSKGALPDILKVQMAANALALGRMDEFAGRDGASALDGNPLAAGLKPYDRPNAPRRDRSAERLADFGERAAEQIKRANEEFDRSPALIDKASQATRQLDALIVDLGKRKPPGFEQLIADAQTAKIAVAEGLNRPFEEYIASQKNALSVQGLINSGRRDEAEAMKITLGLEKDMGALGPERTAAVLATVQALRAEQRETDILREKQQKYLAALDDVGATIKGALSGGLDSIADVPKRMLASFKQLSVDTLFENLFGDAFRKVEDRITGSTIATEAGEKLAGVFDRLAGSATRFAQATDKAAGTPVGGSVAAGASDLAASAAVAAAGGSAAADAAAGDDIVVTASSYPRDPAGFFSYVVKELGKGVLGKDAARIIGREAGDGLQGAAQGQLASGIAKSLGLKQSATGAAVGGAIGNMLPIPGGGFIGGIVGGTIGGFLKTTKTGSATIGNVDGAGGVTGTGGNSSSYTRVASGLADGVIDSLNGIVEALGGDLGGFSGSIGKRGKKFVVDTSGSGRTKGSGTTKFATEAEAQAALLMDAIADGAITGVSNAVQRALKSSTDIDKGLKEALKVQEVEELLGDLGAAMQKQFSTFERQAAERNRIAAKYGFDLVKLEEVNAKERAALFEEVLGSRIQSLQTLLSDLAYGDLFEGSAADRRAKLLEEIGKARADAVAGVDGAGDRYASLSQQLLQTSREGFGTAGSEYSGDRASTVAGAQAIIQLERDRAKAAQDEARKLTGAVEKGNSLTDESNNLLAEQNSYLRQMVAALGGTTAAVPAPAAVTRNVALR